MANWIGVITNAGNSLLNEWVNEKALNFDSAAAGQGIVAEAAMLAQTTLVGQKQTASLLGGERVSAGIRLKLRITAPDTAYTLNQYGVWASVEGGTPAMIALFQHPQGVPIPSKAESPDFVYTFYGLIMCSNTGTWTVTVDTSAVVTAEDLEEAVAGKADQLALAAHEADGVKHVTAAERETLTQGFALLSDDVDTHIARTDNPHGVTAAQVGAVAKTGDTMTGDLTIKKSALPSLNFGTDGAGTATIFKNASSSVEDGLHIKDVDTDGTYAALCIKKIKGLASCLSLSFNGTSYNVYHAGNKPTPADIGAAVKYRYTATIPTGTWTAVSGGGYYKDITVSGITAAMTPCVGVVQTSDAAASELMVEEFANNIRRIETMAGKIRVYTKTDGAIPSVNIPIQLVGTV
ncbi:hypothetical protein [Intestinimonas butyriciproducens]|uniref:hypothetical protein n=1 Tax=Intestinimonas butyriciproducens TaxID=1297617 RepID=UPI0034A46CB7